MKAWLRLTLVTMSVGGGFTGFVGNFRYWCRFAFTGYLLFVGLLLGGLAFGNAPIGWSPTETVTGEPGGSETPRTPNSANFFGAINPLAMQSDVATRLKGPCIETPYHAIDLDWMSVFGNPPALSALYIGIPSVPVNSNTTKTGALGLAHGRTVSDISFWSDWLNPGCLRAANSALARSSTAAIFSWASPDSVRAVFAESSTIPKSCAFASLIFVSTSCSWLSTLNSSAIPPATITIPMKPVTNKNVLGFSGSRIVSRQYADQPWKYSVTRTTNSSPMPITTIHSQWRKQACRDERCTSNLFNNVINLDSSIEQVREDESKIFESQAMTIAIVGLIAIAIVLASHFWNHYKINKKFVKRL